MKQLNRPSLLFKNIERLVNAIAIITLILISVVILAYEILLDQTPCALCYLQRAGYLALAYGFLLNLRFGLRASHYTVILLSALFTSYVALTQTTIYVDEKYFQNTTSMLGLDLSTWSFGITVFTVVVTAILLGLNRKCEAIHSEQSYWKNITHSLFAFLALIIAANIVSVYLQCGFKFCPLIGINSQF